MEWLGGEGCLLDQSSVDYSLEWIRRGTGDILERDPPVLDSRGVLGQVAV